MYHIKPDKRTQKTLKLIVEAFQSCLQRKEYAQITISDLQKESSVSRSTFYRLFDNTDDIVAYLCDAVFERLLEKIRKEPDIRDFHQISLLFIREWMQQSYLLQLLAEIHREDILFDSHKKYFARFSDSDAGKMIPVKLTDYHIALLSSILAAALLTWIKEEKKKSPEQLASCIEGVLDDFEKMLHGRTHTLANRNKNGNAHFRSGRSF